MSIEELIQRDVQTIRAGETCAKAAVRMRDANVGSLVVTTVEDVPIGILTDRDLALRVVGEERAGDTAVGDVMTADPIFLRETASLNDVIATMREQRLRRMIVVDESGRLCGIVTMDDVVIQLGETLALVSAAIQSELEG